MTDDVHAQSTPFYRDFLRKFRAAGLYDDRFENIVFEAGGASDFQHIFTGVADDLSSFHSFVRYVFADDDFLVPLHAEIIFQSGKISTRTRGVFASETVTDRRNERPVVGGKIKSVFRSGNIAVFVNRNDTRHIRAGVRSYILVKTEVISVRSELFGVKSNFRREYEIVIRHIYRNRFVLNRNARHSRARILRKRIEMIPYGRRSHLINSRFFQIVNIYGNALASIIFAFHRCRYEYGEILIRSFVRGKVVRNVRRRFCGKVHGNAVRQSLFGVIIAD